MPTVTVNFPADFRIPGDPVTSSKPMFSERRVQAEEPSSESRSEDLMRLKNSLAEHNISLKFSKDDRTNYLVVQMIDENTGEEIRQFPTQVSLNLAANFMRLQGNFINKVN